ncbi:hypothetical protein FPQ18DRAFT_87167 [Pyronema domesticum]|nr:hypothetical protein FPQ18DRAFT_87167 [Pyronema domesticum]
MDPLSISGAVAGFLSLAGKIATTLKDYVDGVQSAPSEVRSLLLEVTALCQVMKDLVGFLRKDDLNGRRFDSSSVLCIAIKACQCRLKELGAKLVNLSEACSRHRKFPRLVERMKWPLKKDELEQTVGELHRFTQIFQFSMVIQNCELMSGTSSDVISQLNENRQGIEKIVTGLESLSVAVPSDLEQRMSEISKIRTLVSELAHFNFREINNISLRMSVVQERLQDDEIQKIMSWISPLEPHKRHQDIRQNRLEGTGNWFLLQPEFQKWSNSESDDGISSHVLACSGIPGAGKSVICSLVFDHLDTTFSWEERACVACLYCDYRDNKNQTPVNMIGVLLKQVIATLNESGLLPRDTISVLRKHLNKQKNIDLGEACQLLGETAKQLRKFYVCIDALDECNDKHRAEFIQSLAKLSNECGRQSSIRIFFTARPHINWEELMKRNPGLGSLDHIRLDAQPDDIRKYVSHAIEMDENSDCMNDKLRSEILESIVDNSDGMFLLPALQIQTVLDQTTISKRRKALSTMPIKLEMAFESTISRIKNQKSERSTQAMDVLKWTFLAKRPLTVIELRHALSVTIDLGKVQPGKLPLAYDETLDWDNCPSEKSLIDWCLGLVIIDEETSTVRLVHKSLHDHLTQLHENGEIFPDGHNEIAYTCLQYMCFKDDEHEIDATEPEVTEHIKKLRRARFSLLNYTSNNFGYHLRDQISCTVDIIYELFPDRINLNRISTCFRSEFLSPFSRWGERNISHEYLSTSQIHLRLQFAISFRLENVFINIIHASSQSIHLNTKLGGSTMLLQAVRIGHEGIVRILLERGVDVNLADGNNRTALSWASLYGHDSVVKLLLQADGIDINSKDVIGRTALSWASLYGHDSVVTLLLQADGIDINSKDRIFGQTALSFASKEGHDSVVKLLLQADGIDINSKDSKYDRTALSWASKKGHDSL